jgi:hypothetical protein
MKHILRTLACCALAVALQGCGDDAATRSPDITGLADQTVTQDSATATLNFRIGGDYADSGQVTVTASAADATLVPPDGIVLGGSGAMRTLRIIPAEDATGMTNIVVRAVDPAGRRSERSFRLTVNAVTASFRASVGTSYAAGESDSPAAVSGLTFTADADDDPAAFDALLQ